ncbi:unnamed protein product [Owenia fusiformis]|uniref:C-type lectin n=1 Tax=Owenia fusiformis TaxID=6347 RepID=A0A8S4Q3G1_OWEFU|nr:unnamed protein product [Owenia fusiformis]
MRGLTYILVLVSAICYVRGKKTKNGEYTEKNDKMNKTSNNDLCRLTTEEYECNKRRGACKINPCLNGGTCTQLKRGMKSVGKCNCPQGYNGARCEKIVCGDHCDQCNEPGKCSKCNYGYRLHMGECHARCSIEHCSKCDGPESNMCYECYTTFTLSADKTRCIRDCPEGTGVEGTGLYQHGDFCYQVFEQKATYAEANSICMALGEKYDLASVHGCEEHQFLESILASAAYKDIQNWWIGLSKEGNQAKFTTWGDGSPVDYTYWTLDGQGDGNCVGFDRYEGYRFETADCMDAFSFVCKKGVPTMADLAAYAKME